MHIYITLALTTNNPFFMIQDSGEWKNGLTEEIASEKCESQIKSLAAFSVCTTYVPILDSESYIRDCVADMKVCKTTNLRNILRHSKSTNYTNYVQVKTSSGTVS